MSGREQGPVDTTDTAEAKAATGIHYMGREQKGGEQYHGSKPSEHTIMQALLRISSALRPGSVDHAMLIAGAERIDELNRQLAASAMALDKARGEARHAQDQIRLARLALSHS